MENSLTELEIQKEIQKILYVIEEFENGNDEYLEDVIEVVNSIKDYTHRTKSFYLKYKFILLVSKFVTLIYAFNLLSDNSYQHLDEYCHADLDYYMEASKHLSKYIKICSRNENYPDLEAAYLLTIKLSNILSNISLYLNEIRSLERSNNSMYRFISNKDFKYIREKSNGEVESLVKVLDMKIDEARCKHV